MLFFDQFSTEHTRFPLVIVSLVAMQLLINDAGFFVKNSKPKRHLQVLELGAHIRRTAL